MASILTRTAIIYLLLMVALRLMGRREIGQLDASDLVSTLLISELAAIPIDDPEIPLLNAMIPILFILSLEVILSTVKNKSARLGRAIDGDSCFIIYKGRIMQNAMRENRISIGELLSALRTQGVGDPCEVEYALLEQNGTISVLEKTKTQYAHPILVDGEFSKSELKALGWDEGRAQAVLKKNGVRKEEVFLMTATPDGRATVVKKEI